MGATEFTIAKAPDSISIALHNKFDFREVTRDFTFPKVTFSHGIGILYKAALRQIMI